ncbi:MAG: SpoIIE family protein phosphatase [Eubacteriales bacterium]|nr:SpoIIE family protein phosphatase [Eubacteriales bacterium]
MEEVMKQEVFANPYVMQIDKFARSLKHLSEAFLCMEDYKGMITEEEMEDMFSYVTDHVCGHCDNRNRCLAEQKEETRQMLHEILCAAEEYGAELNVELKRTLEKRCNRAPEFLEEALNVFGEVKQKLLWNNRIVQNREGCASSLVSFADMISCAARELDAGIFLDERMERKLKNRFKKSGIKLISTVFFVYRNGKHEFHLTLKTAKRQCVTTKEVGRMVSECVGKTMTPRADEQLIIWDEYSTIVLQEAVRFQSIQGVAKIGKDCQKISGDTFFMTKLSGGKEGIVLSDGMGSGKRAFRESAMVVEMLEELLVAGFPPKSAIQMLNTALVVGREEIVFSTVDMCVIDLYEGVCEFFKAGASTSFIRHRDHVEKLASSSLPVGVLQNIEINHVRRKLEDGDMIVLITDGVMDAFPVNEQEAILGALIQGAKSENPKEIAHYVLEQVLAFGNTKPADDMTVMVVGVWEI